jgi:hypothetical protein
MQAKAAAAAVDQRTQGTNSSEFVPGSLVDRCTYV